MKLILCDFFCGAGGFTEGFRQKGFKPVFALDNWKPAVDTYELNHGLRPSQEDILKLTIEDINNLPDADVYVGSPPCTQFSKSNKGGNGNILEGMSLVKKYLQIIAIKKPKYWILENVPPLKKHLKKSYTFKELGLKGGNKVALRIPKIMLLNASDIGAPQRRERLFCGNFPEPKPVKKAPTLRMVLSSLPNNHSKPNGNKIKDINYGFEIAAAKLTDHYYDCSLMEYEWKEALRQKQDHSFYGKMYFPENMDVPARTVVATQTKYSREAMILPDEKYGYRIPTIRENATLMTFPHTYQFEANSPESKHRLVGNAVIPLESAALAEAILSAEGINIQTNFNMNSKEPSLNLKGVLLKSKEPRKKKYESKFRIHVPYLKIKSFRVDLDNLKSFSKTFRPKWTTSIHHGTGKNNALRNEPSLSQIETTLDKFKHKTKVNSFKKKVDILLTKIPNAKTFQELNCRIKKSKELSPYEALEKIKKLIDKSFPENKFNEICLNNEDRIIKLEKEEIPIRIVAALFATKKVEIETQKSSKLKN